VTRLILSSLDFCSFQLSSPRMDIPMISLHRDTTEDDEDQIISTENTFSIDGSRGDLAFEFESETLYSASLFSWCTHATFFMDRMSMCFSSDEQILHDVNTMDITLDGANDVLLKSSKPLPAAADSVNLNGTKDCNQSDVPPYPLVHTPRVFVPDEDDYSKTNVDEREKPMASIRSSNNSRCETDTTASVSSYRSKNSYSAPRKQNFRHYAKFKADEEEEKTKIGLGWNSSLGKTTTSHHKVDKSPVTLQIDSGPEIDATPPFRSLALSKCKSSLCACPLSHQYQSLKSAGSFSESNQNLALYHAKDTNEMTDAPTRHKRTFTDPDIAEQELCRLQTESVAKSQSLAMKQ